MAEEAAFDSWKNETYAQIVLTLLVGVIVLYIIIVYFETFKSDNGAKKFKSSTLQRKGSVKIEVTGKVDSGLMEAKRDFLRSVEAVYVATENSYTSFQDEIKAIEIEKQSSFIEANDDTNSILEKLQVLIKQKTETKTNIQELSNRVLDHIRVAPGISVLLDAKVFPPSMYQPRYTLVLAREAVHVITDGFTGQPSFGPPDPNKKYTSNRIRYITDNLVNLKTSSDSVNVNYNIKATTITNINDAVDVPELQNSIKQKYIHEFLHK
uniref:Uncharacterized protein n=1 Tax=Aplanochytrium stocchinoi TaxID=215587 RepID=A0A7S3PLX6_9STRA